MWQIQLWGISPPISRTKRLFLKAMPGGFDAHLEWQAFGGAGFKFNDTVVGFVGYRIFQSMTNPTPRFMTLR